MLTEFFSLEGKALRTPPKNGECLVLCEEAETLSRDTFKKGKAVKSSPCMFDGNFGNPLFSLKHPATSPKGKLWEEFVTRTC